MACVAAICGVREVISIDKEKTICSRQLAFKELRQGRTPPVSAPWEIGNGTVWKLPHGILTWASSWEEASPPNTSRTTGMSCFL